MVSGTITTSERDFFEREFKLPEFGRGGTLTPSSSRRQACLSVATDTFEAWGANLEELAKAALPGRDDAFQLVDPGNLRAVLREGSHEVLFLTSSTHCYFDNIERLGRGWLCGRHCAEVEVRELPDLTGGPLRQGGARELTVVGEFNRVGCFPLTGESGCGVLLLGMQCGRPLPADDKLWTREQLALRRETLCALRTAGFEHLDPEPRNFVLLTAADGTERVAAVDLEALEPFSSERVQCDRE